MALIDCPDCGTQVSSGAPSCPKCGYPVASEATKRARRQHGNRVIGILVAVVALAAVAKNCDGCDCSPAPSTPSPTSSTPPPPPKPTTKPQPKKATRAANQFSKWFADTYTREDHARACAKAVHGMAEYTKRFGEPGGLIRADMMLRGGDCYGYPGADSFKCLIGTTMSAHVYDIRTFRGLRLGFLRLDLNALGEPVDTGCCDGVRKATKEYPRAKFGQWEGGCNVKFGRVPP